MSMPPSVHQAPDSAAHGAASAVAAEVKALVEAGARDAARERFASLVALVQRRANRIAYQYLRDPADADEAVQDALVKVFVHIGSYRPELSFDVWFTRILVNACLDRVKGRARHRRWLVTPAEHDEEAGHPLDRVPAQGPTSEQRLLAAERWQMVSRAVEDLPERQRLVFTLSHVDERTPGEIAAATGMSPATVRVHLFRALKRLRNVLGEPA
jgi:RNA polymerase sigma-70 factor (ECF subfamily)